MRNYSASGVYTRNGAIVPYLMLIVIGTVLLVISASLRSTVNKDISAYESTIGIMGYTSYNRDDSTMYRPYATYYVDGQQYEWESNTGISPKPESWEMGKDVEVFYDPANPSDSVVPELSNATAMLGSVFLVIGIVFISVGILMLGLPVLRVIIALFIVGADNKAMTTQEVPNNANGVNLRKN